MAITWNALHTEIRNYLGDIVVPYLWTELELKSYANQALTEISKKALLIPDSRTTAICQIPIIVSPAVLSTYELHHSIIRIRKARLQTANKIIYPYTLQQMEERFGENWDTRSGGTSIDPDSFVVDLNVGYITLFPPPYRADTLLLSVFRKPIAIDDLTGEYLEPVSLEIEDVLDGIAFRAYRKQDAETLDVTKSASHFKMWVEKIEQVKRDKLNRDYTPDINGVHAGLL